MNLELLIARTEGRAEGFQFIHDLVKQGEIKSIMETGCMRDADNYLGDGCSTMIWDAMACDYDLLFHTVDIDQQAVDLCNSMMTCGHASCANSIEYLWKHQCPIDLLYLDSLDSHQPGAPEHQLMELTAAMPQMKINGYVMCDDFYYHGKGRLVNDFMNHIKAQKIFHRGIQAIFKL